MVLVVHLVDLRVVVELHNGCEGHLGPNELDDVDYMRVAALVQDLKLLLQVVEKQGVLFRKSHILLGLVELKVNVIQLAAAVGRIVVLDTVSLLEDLRILPGVNLRGVVDAAELDGVRLLE